MHWCLVSSVSCVELFEDLCLRCIPLDLNESESSSETTHITSTNFLDLLVTNSPLSQTKSHSNCIIKPGPIKSGPIDSNPLQTIINNAPKVWYFISYCSSWEYTHGMKKQLRKLSASWLHVSIESRIQRLTPVFRKVNGEKTNNSGPDEHSASRSTPHARWSN